MSRNVSRGILNITRSLNLCSNQRARVLSGSALHWSGSSSSSSSSSSSGPTQPYISKYAEQLSKKAKEEGYESIEAMRKEKLQNTKVDKNLLDELKESTPEEKRTASKDAKPLGPAAPTKKPVKTLNDFVNLEKLRQESSQGVETLWKGYHTQKGKLSAVIPADMYKSILANAKKYPQFVVPLERNSEGDKEMHFLQWSILNHSLTETPSQLPNPSTLIYTPLAHYQVHKDFATPFLILTHYTDLAESHGIVLMRGEITPDVQLQSTEAQMLIVMASLFYGSKDGEMKKQVLSDFHERPQEFSIERLLEAASTIAS